MPVRKDRAADRVLIIESALTDSELAPSLVAAGFSLVRIHYNSEALLALILLKPDIVLMDRALMNDAENYHSVRSALDVPVLLVGEDHHVEMWAKSLPGAIKHDGSRYIDLIQRLTAVLEEVKREQIERNN